MADQQPPPAAPPAQGKNGQQPPAAGGNQGGNQGRNNNNRRNNNNNNNRRNNNGNNNNTPTSPPFIGTTKELGELGCVYLMPGDKTDPKKLTWGKKMSVLLQHITTLHPKASQGLDLVFDERNPELPIVPAPIPHVPEYPTLAHDADAAEHEQHTKTCKAVDQMSQRLNSERITRYMNNQEAFDDCLRVLFKIILGQVAESLYGRIEDSDVFRAKCSEGDCVWLLNRVRGLSTSLSDTQDIYMAGIISGTQLFTVTQSAKKGTATNEADIQNIRAIDALVSTVGLLRFNPDFDPLMPQVLTRKRNFLSAPNFWPALQFRNPIPLDTPA